MVPPRPHRDPAPGEPLPDAGATLALPEGLVAGTAAFLVALVVRLVFVVEGRDDLFFTHRLVDEVDYHVIATRALAGTWPGPEALFRPPLYPAFLAGVYRLVGDDIITVKLVQVALGALAAPLAVGIGMRLFGSARLALAAGLAVALCGTLVYFDGQLLAASLDVLLVLAATGLVLRAQGTGTAPDWAVAGAVLGAAALNRGGAILFAPVVVAWTLRAAGRAGRGRALRTMGVFLAAAAIVVAPLAWHNARNDERPEGAYAQGAPAAPTSVASVGETLARIVRGRFAPLGWADGINLYLGNIPELADVNRNDQVAHFTRYLAITAEPWQAGARTASEHSAWLKARTFEYARAHPGRWLLHLGGKLRDVVDGFEIPRGGTPYADRAGVLALLLWEAPLRFPSGLLLPLGLVGAWTFRRDERLGLVGLLLVTQLAFVVAFFVTARYRAPALPLCALLTVALVDGWLKRLRRREAWPAGVLAGVAAAGLLVVVANLHRPGQSMTRGSNEQYDLANELAGEGKPEQAIAQYRDAIAVEPRHASARSNLGRLLQDQGRVDEALDAYRTALAIDPRSAITENNFGTALLAKGDAAGAEQAFRACTAIDPHYARAHLNLGLALSAENRADEAAAEYALARAGGLSAPER